MMEPKQAFSNWRQAHSGVLQPIVRERLLTSLERILELSNTKHMCQSSLPACTNILGIYS